MRRLAVLIALAASVCVNQAAKADGTATERGATPARPPGVIPPGVIASRPAASEPDAAKIIDELDKAVTLTKEQKQKMTDVMADRDKKVQVFRTQNAEKIKAAAVALEEAYKSQDRQTEIKASQGYRELYAPLHAIMKKAQSDLMGTLTVKQLARYAEFRLVEHAKESVKPVELSDEQVRKLREAAGDLVSANLQVDSGKMWKMVQELLTDEQRALWQETWVKGPVISFIKGVFADAKLTDEQLKAVDAAYDELAKQKPKLTTHQIGEKLREKVQAMLTDAQKNAMKNAKEERARTR